MCIRDRYGNSTVWDDSFATDQDALDEALKTIAEDGKMCISDRGELALFDDPEVLEYPWDLSPYDAAPTVDDLSALGAGPVSYTHLDVYKRQALLDDNLKRLGENRY